MTYSQVAQRFNISSNSSWNDVMTVVAFSGPSVMTAPRLTRSGPTMTWYQYGQGIVSSVALLGYFNAGNLQYLTW